MQYRTENIIGLSEYLAEKNMQSENRQYRCYMTNERLEGHCEVLIYDAYQKQAEWFDLQYARNGRSSHCYLDQEEFCFWMRKKNILPITYEQALILLGDLARIHQENNRDALEESIHFKRVWEPRYYDARKSSLDWLLIERDIDELIQLYLKALNNKDAALLYDFVATDEKKRMPRDLYLYNWHHILEPVTVFDYDLVWKEWQENEQRWNCFLTVSGETEDCRVLSIDIELALVQEKNCLKIQSEQVGEARKIYDRRTGV